VRECPACGYPNSDPAAQACGVCGRGLSAVAERAPAEGRRPDRLMPALAVLLLLCALAAFYLAHRRIPAPVPGESAFADEAGFGYEGVLYSLAAMGEQRFLPPEDKLRVLPLLDSRDERVAAAAAGLAGKWLESETDPALAGALRLALEKAAAGAPPAVRERAAAALAPPRVSPKGR